MIFLLICLFFSLLLFFLKVKIIDVCEDVYESSEAAAILNCSVSVEMFTLREGY